jgi:hypothetical protein
VLPLRLRASLSATLFFALFGSASFAQTSSFAEILITPAAPGSTSLLASAALPDAPSALQSPAQDTPQAATPPPAIETDDQRRAREKAESATQLKQEEKQRLAGIVPNFNVVLGGKALPLTPGQKWNLALHSAIDPFYIAYAAVYAGYSEIADDDNGFGWGPAGYFKRVGANYADTVNGALIGNALLPVILHQDPRYFRQGTGTIRSRFLHAALSTIVCKGDNGKNQANVSNVLGNFISGAISNAYYPANERGVGLTLENGATVTAFGAVGGQVLEFAPDILRHFHKKSKTP